MANRLGFAGFGVTPQAQSVYQALIRGDQARGVPPLSPAVAAGVVGNMMQESYTDIRPNAGAGTAHQGVAQWDANRFADMQTWTTGRGLNPNSREGQALFYSHELQNDPKSMAALAGVSTPEDAARVIENKFERSGGSKVANRQGYAKAVGDWAAKTTAPGYGYSGFMPPSMPLTELAMAAPTTPEGLAKYGLGPAQTGGGGFGTASVGETADLPNVQAISDTDMRPMMGASADQISGGSTTNVLRGAAGTDQLATSRKGGNVFQVRMEGLLSDAEAATGAKRVVTDTYRDPMRQAQYWANFSGRTFTYKGQTFSRQKVGGLAARPPGLVDREYPGGAPGSRHQKWDAWDLGKGKVRDWVRDTLNTPAGRRKYGVETLPSGKDLPHIQIARDIKTTAYDVNASGDPRDYAPTEAGAAPKQGGLAAAVAAGQRLSPEDLAAEMGMPLPKAPAAAGVAPAGVDKTTTSSTAAAGPAPVAVTAAQKTAAANAVQAAIASHGGKQPASQYNVTPEARETYNTLIQGNKALGIPALSPMIAQGAVGNMMQEAYPSLISDWQANPKGVGKGGEKGIGQWMPDRYGEMETWARQHSLNPLDRKTQALYYSHELQSKYPQVMAKLNAAKSPTETAGIIVEDFERAGNAAMPDRVAYAETLAADMGGAGGAAAPQPATGINQPIGGRLDPQQLAQTMWGKGYKTPTEVAAAGVKPAEKPTETAAAKPGVSSETTGGISKPAAAAAASGQKMVVFGLPGLIERQTNEEQKGVMDAQRAWADKRNATFVPVPAIIGDKVNDKEASNGFIKGWMKDHPEQKVYGLTAFSNGAIVAPYIVNGMKKGTFTEVSAIGGKDEKAGVEVTEKDFKGNVPNLKIDSEHSIDAIHKAAAADPPAAAAGVAPAAVTEEPSTRGMKIGAKPGVISIPKGPYGIENVVKAMTGPGTPMEVAAKTKAAWAQVGKNAMTGGNILSGLTKGKAATEAKVRGEITDYLDHLPKETQFRMTRAFTGPDGDKALQAALPEGATAADFAGAKASRDKALGYGPAAETPAAAAAPAAGLADVMMPLPQARPAQPGDAKTAAGIAAQQQVADAGLGIPQAGFLQHPDMNQLPAGATWGDNARAVASAGPLTAASLPSGVPLPRERLTPGVPVPPMRPGPVPADALGGVLNPFLAAVNQRQQQRAVLQQAVPTPGLVSPPIPAALAQQQRLAGFPSYVPDRNRMDEPTAEEYHAARQREAIYNTMVAPPDVNRFDREGFAYVHPASALAPRTDNGLVVQNPMLSQSPAAIAQRTQTAAGFGPTIDYSRPAPSLATDYPRATKDDVAYPRSNASGIYGTPTSTVVPLPAKPTPTSAERDAIFGTTPLPSYPERATKDDLSPYQPRISTAVVTPPPAEAAGFMGRPSTTLGFVGLDPKKAAVDPTEVGAVPPDKAPGPGAGVGGAGRAPTQSGNVYTSPVGPFGVNQSNVNAFNAAQAAGYGSTPLASLGNLRSQGFSMPNFSTGSGGSTMAYMRGTGTRVDQQGNRINTGTYYDSHGNPHEYDSG